MSTNVKPLHICNFCGKNQTQVATLVAGNGVYICNECVTLCMEAIKPPQEPPQPVDKISLSPPQIVEFLDQYVIGQNLAKKTLAVAIYNHFKRLRYPEVDGVQIDKSNILMIGNSGVGKTHMVKTLARVLEVPFAVVDATSLSQTGYVGLDPEECLARLYSAAEGDLEKAQQGIVFIDEIDKIGRKGENVSTTRDVSGEGVQQALLKIIEGSDVKFTPTGARKNPNGDFVTMNTSHILFILGGAFEGLADIIQHRGVRDNSRMGFGSTLQQTDSKTTFNVIREVQVEDLISFGLIPELVGRIPVILPFEDLDLPTLCRILVEPRNSLVKQYEKLFALDNIELVVTPAAVQATAGKVLSTRTGARGLRSVLENVLMESQFHIRELHTQGVRKLIVDQDQIENLSPPHKVIDA
jgi:ATP-dependent Clp protease ATP-binding subunit ClpX